MKTKHNGFTLVELIVVVLIIGIIAFFSVPKFIDLGTRSKQAATDSIAASLTIESAANYAKRNANSSQGIAIANCTQIGALLTSGIPDGYTIAPLTISAGSNASCILNGPGPTTATFVGRGIS